jgi:conjugal transfer ATP-binding protein TraC
MTTKLTQLFTPIPPGYGVQWTLMGSSIFDDKLQAYMDMRHVAVDNGRTSPFFVELADQRVGYVRKSKGRPLFPNTNYMVKATKLMFSVTKTGSHQDKRLVQDMWELREALRSQLRTSNLPAFHGDPTSLIRFIRPMLDPELFFSQDVAPDIVYDDGRSIKDQVTPFGQHVRVKHDEILFGKPPEKETDEDTRIAMRSFGVQHYPQKKELWEMANIIGSFFDDGLQYPCPFVICGGVFTLDPAELDAKIPLKAARAKQNAKSKMAEFQPELALEADDWNVVLHQQNNGGSLTSLYHTLLIYAPKKTMQRVAGVAMNVWKSERFSWQLTKLMHRFPEDGPFERRMQVAELDYIASSKAAQNVDTGQSKHFGERGVQMVAPRSISAWAQSPGRSSVTSSPARRFSSGLLSGIGASTANSRDMTRSTLPSTTLVSRSKAMALTAAAV